MSFSITTETVDDQVAAVAVSGYVDFDAAPALKHSLVDCIEAGRSQLVVDLAEAGFIDSTAIGVLAGASRRLAETSGGSLAVVCTDENVLRIFEIAGIETMLTLYGSRDEALAAPARAG